MTVAAIVDLILLVGVCIVILLCIRGAGADTMFSPEDASHDNDATERHW